MKIGAFVLGGLTGAAAVILLRKQSVASMAGGLSQMMSSRGAKKESQEKGLNVLFGSASSSAKSKNNESHGEASQNGSLEQVEHIASQDAGVKKEINDILDQNEQPHI